MVKLRPGDPLSAISAREYNRHVDVADWFERTQRLGSGGAGAASKLDGTVVKVLNSTGGDFRQFDAVGLGAPSVTLGSGSLVFAAVQPTTSLQGVWGIAIDPLPDGEMGRVKISGPVPAYVTLADTLWHDYATPSSTAGVLEPSSSGAADIIYSPLTTGEQLCVIRLGIKQATSSTQAKWFTYYEVPGPGTTLTAGGASANVVFWSGVPVSQPTTLFNFNGTDYDVLVAQEDGWYAVAYLFALTPAAGYSSNDGSRVVVAINGAGYESPLTYPRPASHELDVRYFGTSYIQGTIMLRALAGDELTMSLQNVTGWGTQKNLDLGASYVDLVKVS